MVTGLVTGAFWSLAPVYARQSGFDTFQLTLLMSATVLGGAFFQLPLGRLSDHYDRRIILMISAIAAVVISLLFVMLPATLASFDGWLVTALAFLWGGTVMTQYAICLAHATDTAEPEDFVEIGSAMLLTLGLCSALGGPMASLVMQLMGNEGLYAFAGLCMAGFAVITAWRRHAHEVDVPVDGHEHFQPVADMATPAAYEMDPRTEDSSDALASVDEPPKP